MVFYKCGICELLTSEVFKKCPSCGVDGLKTKELYAKVVDMGELLSKPIEESSEED